MDNSLFKNFILFASFITANSFYVISLFKNWLSLTNNNLTITIKISLWKKCIYYVNDKYQCDYYSNYLDNIPKWIIWCQMFVYSVTIFFLLSFILLILIYFLNLSMKMRIHLKRIILILIFLSGISNFLYKYT